MTTRSNARKPGLTSQPEGPRDPGKWEGWAESSVEWQPREDVLQQAPAG
jgi:hypothetical protein